MSVPSPWLLSNPGTHFSSAHSRIGGLMIVLVVTQAVIGLASLSRAGGALIDRCGGWRVHQVNGLGIFALATVQVGACALVLLPRGYFMHRGIFFFFLAWHDIVTDVDFFFFFSFYKPVCEADGGWCRHQV